MREIDAMLDRWIFNNIIRKQIRDLIVKKINQEKTKTNRDGRNKRK